MNDRLAVWRQRRDPETSRALFLAKVNDRLAVWRQNVKTNAPAQRVPLAKVNDRLAVWRLVLYKTTVKPKKLAKVNDRLAVWRHCLALFFVSF